MKTNSILTRACLQTLEARRLFNFGPAVDYAAGSAPIATVVADLNGDTRPDIAVANYSSGNVSVLLGNANGTFPASEANTVIDRFNALSTTARQSISSPPMPTTSAC